MITYSTSTSRADFEQILSLQQANTPQTLSGEELTKEGFVTVCHSPELLAAMNQPYPHIVARNDKGEVVGFALTMLREFENSIPVLVPMFELINTLEYKGQPLKDARYCVMGQVCIAKDYRGQGIFSGLYQHFKQQLSPHFDYCITEVATRNHRSMGAHHKVGFRDLQQYTSAVGGEEWMLVLWDWQQKQKTSV